MLYIPNLPPYMVIGIHANSSSFTYTTMYLTFINHQEVIYWVHTIVLQTRIKDVPATIHINHQSQLTVLSGKLSL